MLLDHQSSLWPGVAAGDPRSVGRPSGWRRMNCNQADPLLGATSRDVATQSLIDTASAALERLADRCPTCSADLELRDRTYGLTLSTCLFCHRERPRQVDVSLESTPTAWSPPLRVPKTHCCQQTTLPGHVRGLHLQFVSNALIGNDNT